jgi:hypothetical protein
VLELVNGERLMVGDRVRFAGDATLEGAGGVDAGSEGMVEEVERHRHNRAVVRLDDERWATIHPLMHLEIVRPAQEPTPIPREHDLSAGVAPHQERWTCPLPAKNQLESVARWEATDHLPRALALYDALGQLHVSDTPQQEVARLWLADQEATIVVQTWAQAAAVREEIARALTEVDPTTVPPVLVADAAYLSRLEAQRSGEPALAPQRAYVLAELHDHDALTRALSVAEESHVVAGPPDELTTELQAMHAREIAATLRAVEVDVSALADSGREATAMRAQEPRIEAGLQQGEAERLAELQVHDAERGERGS